MGGTDYQSLLTDEARRAQLHDIFGHRFRHQGKLQLPSLTQYNSLEQADGLPEIGIEICRWIGLKPDGLSITLGKTSPETAFTVDTAAKNIRIDPAYTNHPYSLGALLVFAIVTYAVQKFDRSNPDKAFVELASIELGLGVWITNALSPRVKPHHKLYHLLDSSWYHYEALTLDSYSAGQYAELLVRFAHDNRIPPDAYLPHIPERGQHLFNGFTRSQSNRHMPEPRTTILHKQSARKLIGKLIIVALIIASAITLAFYITANDNPDNSGENKSQLQNIEQLKTSYSDCQSEATRLQSSYDPNDLFLTRQVDATKSRCESLRNEYNYAVDQYTNSD